jgi:hypothetical protein
MIRCCPESVSTTSAPGQASPPKTQFDHQPKDLADLLELYVTSLRNATAWIPSAAGLFVGTAVLVFGLTAAWSSVPAAFRTGPISPASIGATALTAILAVLVVTALDFIIVGLGYHYAHVAVISQFRSTCEAASSGEPPSPTSGQVGSADITNWQTFIQGRMDSLTSWVQALAALGALIPVSSLIQTAPSVQTTVLTACVIAVFAGVLVWASFTAFLRAVRRRDGLVLLQALLLGKLLKSNERVAEAYLAIVGEDDRIAADSPASSVPGVPPS